MYGFPLRTHVQGSPKGRGGAVRPTKPHPSCTKMSLTFVFAPVEVREEMAAALPVSLQPPLSYKIANKWTLKGFFVVFKAATPERPTSGGQWSCIYLGGGGLRKGLEDVAGDGRRWPIRWCLGPASQGFDRRRSVGLMTVEAFRTKSGAKRRRQRQREKRGFYRRFMRRIPTSAADLRPLGFTAGFPSVCCFLRELAAV